jgi:lipid II:glycine glycyltransferase (peptidoglycan interpeptide bridge formation enzyme)
MSEADCAIVNSVNVEDWDQFSSGSSQGTVFSRIEWLKSQSVLTATNLSFLIGSHHDAMQYAMPLLSKKKWGMNILTSNPLSPYNGLLLSGSLQNETELLDAIKSALKKAVSGFSFISISLHPSLKDLRPFMWEGWELQKLYTYWVDIASEEAFWANFSQSLRRKVRKAESAGIRIKESTDTQLLANQYSHSYQRHGVKEPIASELISDWVQNAIDGGLAKMYVAYDAHEKALCSRVILRDMPFVYDWIAGSSAEADSQSANHALVTHIMRKHSALGFKTFDFRGANTPGVIEFKRSFGGALVPYTQAIYRSSPFISIAERFASAITRFRRRG